MTQDISIQSHIASLLGSRPHSFCIVSDNALAAADADAMSTKATPRRAKSASRSSLPSGVNKPYSSKRALPSPRRRARGQHQQHLNTTDDENANPSLSSGLSRWSSSPKESDRSMGMPPRRGLSTDSKVHLHTLACSSNNKNSSTTTTTTSSSKPPSMPTRQLLDDEECSSTSTSFSSSCSASSMPPYVRSDMSLAHCLVQSRPTHSNRKDKDGKVVRQIRRPRSCDKESKRRNIVDILDAALGSLELDDQ